MNRIYLDNGATSFPKAPGVVENITKYLVDIGGNVNRGAYDASYEAENIVFETRELLCKLFNFHRAENVVFTRSITESLNVILKGYLKKGDHIIISSMEHNAVMRPLRSLEKLGITCSIAKCNTLGELDPNCLPSLVKPNTKAVVMTHSSNVCGTILPLEEVGRFCKDNKLILIVDSAQTAGFLDIDMNKMNIDILCFTGHKSLLGPQGIGGFLIREHLVEKVSPLIEGGTGSLSEYEVQPEYMPDKFESGTLNIPGIYGLNASLKYILNEGIKNIKAKELELTQVFLKEVSKIPQLDIIGLKTIENRTAVVSLNFAHQDNGEIAHLLSKDYGISTRCGLHCAPSAHKTLGTFPDGTVRFSFSSFNTSEEVHYTVNAIRAIINTFIY
ncbi:cysteine desulfurase family protein [Clostridium punense]|uniref:cysteine desulfurase n=1 Tax=Clostridium punense TaxID=1054297 RepID=A0ABS4K5K9_9CLOT|nr:MULTISPECIES: aminotransferase class V-fold PLP-dependent enzyme [Clostridium]EQB89195.1 hypothetical protein M918_21450 [Clostridium sp. BL8]MBP2023060.1 cysteine desulfurase family protein [Clostridium punense]